MAEKKLISASSQAQYAELFTQSHNVYYSTVHCALALSKRFKELRPNLESFNVRQLLKYLIELHTIEAINNNNIVELFIESSFPNEVTGERIKIELILEFTLKYFVKHVKNDKIKIAGKLKDIDNECFCLLFEFECTENETVTNEKLKEVFIDEQVDLNKYETPLENKQLKELLKWLKGSSKLTQNENRLCLRIEVSVKIYDQSQRLIEIPTIKIFPRKQVTMYTTMWSKEINESEAKSSESIVKVLNSPQMNDTKARELVQEKLKLLKQSEDDKKVRTQNDLKILRSVTMSKELQKGESSEDSKYQKMPSDLL